MTFSKMILDINKKFKCLKLNQIKNIGYLISMILIINTYIEILNLA